MTPTERKRIFRVWTEVPMKDMSANRENAKNILGHA
jgi:hypothetical protein